jgi:transcription initiation factor TFIIB
VICLKSEKGLVECPVCKSSNLVHDRLRGEIICRDCGSVIEDQEIDRGPEWRAFDLEEENLRSRVGMPREYSFSDSFSTTFDVSSRKLPPSTLHRMWRLKKCLRDSFSYQQRNLFQAMTELNRLCDNLNIPEAVKEAAAIIYRKALKKKLVRGRSINCMITASLYVACRISGVPRNLEEIAEVSLIEKKMIARDCRVLLKELGFQPPIDDPIKFIPSIAAKIGISRISPKIQETAVEILQKAKEKKLTVSRSPKVMATAALYAAIKMNGQNITQKEMAEAAGITEVSLRNRKEELCKKLGLSIPIGARNRSFLLI